MRWLRTPVLLVAAVGLAPAFAQTVAPVQSPAPVEAVPGAAEAQATATDALQQAAAAAESLPETPADAAAALAEIESSISLTTERAAALKAEIEAMQGDRARQSAELIAAAQRVKLAETDIAAMEARLGDLIVAELEVRGRLEGARWDPLESTCRHASLSIL